MMIAVGRMLRAEGEEIRISLADLAATVGAYVGGVFAEILAAMLVIRIAESPDAVLKVIIVARIGQ